MRARYLRELVEVGQKEYKLRLKGKSRERFNVNPFFRILSPGYPSAFTSRFFLDADRNINDGEAYKLPLPHPLPRPLYLVSVFVLKPPLFSRSLVTSSSFLRHEFYARVGDSHST